MRTFFRVREELPCLKTYSFNSPGVTVLSGPWNESANLLRRIRRSRRYKSPTSPSAFLNARNLLTASVTVMFGSFSGVVFAKARTASMTLARP